MAAPIVRKAVHEMNYFLECVGIEDGNHFRTRTEVRTLGHYFLVLL